MDRVLRGEQQEGLRHPDGLAVSVICAPAGPLPRAWRAPRRLGLSWAAPVHAHPQTEVDRRHGAPVCPHAKQWNDGSAAERRDRGRDALVHRTPEDAVFVPFALEIRPTLARNADAAPK